MKDKSDNIILATWPSTRNSYMYVVGIARIPSI